MSEQSIPDPVLPDCNSVPGSLATVSDVRAVLRRHAHDKPCPRAGAALDAMKGVVPDFLATS